MLLPFARGGHLLARWEGFFLVLAAGPSDPFVSVYRSGTPPPFRLRQAYGVTCRASAFTSGLRGDKPPLGKALRDPSALRAPPLFQGRSWIVQTALTSRGGRGVGSCRLPSLHAGRSRIV